MKKSSVISLLIVSLALFVTSLTSCVTHNSGEDYVFSAQKIWIVGNEPVFGPWEPTKALELTKSGNIFEGEFKATQASVQFKIIVDDNSNWDKAYWSGDSTPIALGTPITAAKLGGMDNITLTATVDTVYKITVDGTRNTAPVFTVTKK